ELSALFEAHIHEQNERRFIVDADGDSSGLVELVEINTVHRSAEFQIIIATACQGRGLAVQATRLALDYGFSVLNLHKIYLIVDR
ncbi:GNAT family N-acetyltransferase, partial [Salmonella enterica subsp. enterica serovar Infantis]|uniref:GNAT family N-acetyltransferase n=1 Tax=Salmonella enterica TaxID=28901 RepID=UPI0039E98B3B